VVMEYGGMVAVGQRMGGEEAARASDTVRKGMLEARVWAAEAILGSVSGPRRALTAVAATSSLTQVCSETTPWCQLSPTL
jgi:hypothetical protein